MVDDPPPGLPLVPDAPDELAELEPPFEPEPPFDEPPGSASPPQPTAAVAETSARTMPQEAVLLDERCAARRRVRWFMPTA